MRIYIIKRLLQMVVVLIGTTLVVFLMMHFLPGDPALIMAGERANLEQLAQMRENLGLTEPLHTQYFRFVKGAIQGDLGRSIRTNQLVAEEIFSSRFFITTQLAFLASLVTMFMGLFIGIISATRKYSLIDVSLMLVSLFGLSMPSFWLGVLFIFIFGVNLGWLPISGWGDSFAQVILPSITLGIVNGGIVARMTRSSLLDVFSQDYIRTAYAKGLSERRVIFKHGLRNALIPVVTVVGLQFGALLGGAIITENVFAINGLGRLLVVAIRSRDFPMVQGIVLVFATLYTLVNFLVDITYRLLNKRIDYSEKCK